jgi:hypothetical protein
VLIAMSSAAVTSVGERALSLCTASTVAVPEKGAAKQDGIADVRNSHAIRRRRRFAPGRRG